MNLDTILRPGFSISSPLMRPKSGCVCMSCWGGQPTRLNHLQILPNGSTVPDLYIRNYLLPRGIETALDLVKDIAEKGSFYSSWLLFQKLPAKEERELKALQESFQEIFQKAVSLTPQIGDCFKNPSQKFSDAGSTYRNNNLLNTIITNKE